VVDFHGKEATTMTRRIRRFVQEHPVIPEFAGRAIIVAIAGLLLYALGIQAFAQLVWQ
jgi:hypothetical protein